MSLLNIYTESYNTWIICGKYEQLREDKQRWFLPSPNSNFEEVIIASAGEVISRVTQSRQVKVWNNEGTRMTKWRGFYVNSLLLLQCSSKHGWLGNCSEQSSRCYKTNHKRRAKSNYPHMPMNHMQHTPCIRGFIYPPSIYWSPNSAPDTKCGSWKTTTNKTNRIPAVMRLHST